MSCWGHIIGIVHVSIWENQATKKLFKERHPITHEKVPCSLGYFPPRENYNKVLTKKARSYRWRVRARQWKRALKEGLPRGSEGPIEWYWHSYKDPHAVKQGYFNLVGDIRDVHSLDVFKPWLINLKDKLSCYGIEIDSAAIQITIDNGQHYNIVFDNNSQNFIFYPVTDASKVLYGIQ